MGRMWPVAFGAWYYTGLSYSLVFNILLRTYKCTMISEDDLSFKYKVNICKKLLFLHFYRKVIFFLLFYNYVTKNLLSKLHTRYTMNVNTTLANTYYIKRALRIVSLINFCTSRKPCKWCYDAILHNTQNINALFFGAHGRKHFLNIKW